MITFWGEVALTTMAGYAAIAWGISKLPSSKRPIKPSANQPDHGLHDSNKDRSINQSHGWR